MCINSDVNASEDIASRPSVWRLLYQCLVTIAKFLVTLGLWPLYLLGCLLYGRPPTVAPVGHVWHCLELTWKARPPAPGITTRARIDLSLQFLQLLALVPVRGLAWQFDEFLYSRQFREQLNDQRVEFLFLISAGRSGSTQTQRHLEADVDRFVSPCVLQFFFPYLWAWKIVPPIAKWLGITPDKVRQHVASVMPEEMQKRHPEWDPFAGDTLDPFFLSFHGSPWSMHLGPKVALKEFNFARHSPHHQHLWERDFVTYVQRLGQKTLLYNSSQSIKLNKRIILLKGHFVNAAPILAAHFPTAKFVTVVREPLAKIISGIHFLRVQPVQNPGLGHVPWRWIAAWAAQMETDYGKAEQAFFTSGAITSPRCILKFDDMIRHPERALQRLYQELFNTETPETIRHALHNKQTKYPRGGYAIQRSFDELGLDQNKILRENAEFIAWCNSIPGCS